MISILGIPYDLDSSYLRGAALAPPAIRRAFRSPASNTSAENEVELDGNPSIEDKGDLNLDLERDIRAQISAAVRDLVQQNGKVLFLGGDHSITYPILQGMATKYGQLNIVQLDAHPDLYDQLNGNRYSHACPFARSCEEGLIARLVQVGIRTMNKHQRQQADRWNVKVIRAAELTAAGLQASPAQLISAHIESPVYISLDMDVLDPAFAPGVSHYEPGGLSVREVLTIIQGLDIELVGADIVEFNPSRDDHGRTAMVAAKFMKELLAKML